MKITTAGREFDICFMTPTWRGDLDRFALLRESLVAFGHGAVPHYALINTEDKPLLENLRLPNVIAVTTAELLSPALEAGRLRYLHAWGGRRWKTFKRSLNKRFGLFPDALYYGWHIQQLIKLQAPTQLPHDVFISFDSDNIITGTFALEDFVPGGKVVLHENTGRRAPNQKPEPWFTNACRLLDVPVPPDYQRDYVNQPVVFEKHAMQAMHAWLEQRYRRPWYESILGQKLGNWSEFMTYGVFVRDHLKLKGFTIAVTNSENLWIFNDEQRRDSAQLIRRAFEDPAIKLLVLQTDHSGRWPLSRFMPELRKHLGAVTQGRNLLK